MNGRKTEKYIDKLRGQIRDALYRSMRHQIRNKSQFAISILNESMTRCMTFKRVNSDYILVQYHIVSYVHTYICTYMEITELPFALDEKRTLTIPSTNPQRTRRRTKERERETIDNQFGSRDYFASLSVLFFFNGKLHLQSS